jgi:hypothetical protein
MRRKLPPKDPDRRHSARIADFINAIGTSRTCGDVRYLVASGGKADKASDGRTIAIYA